LTVPVSKFVIAITYIVILGLVIDVTAIATGATKLCVCNILDKHVIT